MTTQKHDVRVGDRREGNGRFRILVEVLAFTAKGARVRLPRQAGKEKNISISTLGTAYDLVGRLCAHCGTVFKVDIRGEHQRMCPARDGDFCEAPARATGPGRAER